MDSHSTGQVSRKTGKTSDPDANWGKHETAGIDGKTGNLWTKAKSWFGFRLHADTRYEIPVDFSADRGQRAAQGEAAGRVRPH